MVTTLNKPSSLIHKIQLEAELLASQPTMTRLENHLSKQEVSAIRSRLVEGFIQRYQVAPAEIVLLFPRLLWAAHVLSSAHQRSQQRLPIGVATASG